MTTKINLKRVYDDPDGHDGYRVLVDRLWPQGESKERFHYDQWEKNLAPSTELRKWFHEDPENRWPQFYSRYMSELEENSEATAWAESLRDKSEVTLLYASRDLTHNNAVVVADYLRKRLQ